MVLTSSFSAAASSASRSMMLISSNSAATFRARSYDSNPSARRRSWISCSVWFPNAPGTSSGRERSYFSMTAFAWSMWLSSDLVRSRKIV